MYFKRIIFYTLLIGLLLGTLLTLVQYRFVVPIIFAAEQFESVNQTEAADKTLVLEDRHSHEHEHEGWSPEDGVQRTFYTWLSTVLTTTGFAAVMLSLMSFMNVIRGVRLDWYAASLWGFAGFACFFVLPSLGLPPEIPGVEASPLVDRQLWWLVAVLSSLVCLFGVMLLSSAFKLICIGSLLLPFVWMFPEHPELTFRHTDASVVDQLSQLHQSFILATSISNLLLWLGISLTCGWVAAHKLRDASTFDDDSAQVENAS